MQPLLPLTLVGLTLVAFVPVAPADSVASLAFSFVIPCDDPAGVNTDTAYGVVMPAGVYAVAITGACNTAMGASLDRTFSTPCTVENTDVPCADLTIKNLPPAACHWDVGHVTTWGCTEVKQLACNVRVLVDEQCPATGNGGFIVHSHSGGVTARFADLWHGDNEGSFLVTLTWTPLTAPP